MKYYRNPNPPRTGNPSRSKGLPDGFHLYYTPGERKKSYLLVCSIPHKIATWFGDAVGYDYVELTPNSHVGDGSYMSGWDSRSYQSFLNNRRYKECSASVLSPNMREVADLFINSILDEIAVDPDRRADAARDVYRRAMGAAPVRDSTDAMFDALYNPRDRNPRTRNPSKADFDRVREVAVSLSQPYNSVPKRYAGYSPEMRRLSEDVNKAAYNLRYELDGGWARPNRVGTLITAVERFADYIDANKHKFSRVAWPIYSDTDALHADLDVLRPYAQSGILHPNLG